MTGGRGPSQPRSDDCGGGAAP